MILTQSDNYATKELLNFGILKSTNMGTQNNSEAEVARLASKRQFGIKLAEAERLISHHLRRWRPDRQLLRGRTWFPRRRLSKPRSHLENYAGSNCNMCGILQAEFWMRATYFSAIARLTINATSSFMPIGMIFTLGKLLWNTRKISSANPCPTVGMRSKSSVTT